MGRSGRCGRGFDLERPRRRLCAARSPSGAWQKSRWQKLEEVRRRWSEGSRRRNGCELKRKCGRVLSRPPVLERSKSADSAGGGANAVGAAVGPEEKPIGSSGGDQVATAGQASLAIHVVELDVPANLLESAQDLAARPEKEIVSNHGEGVGSMPLGLWWQIPRQVELAKTAATYQSSLVLLVPNL